MNMNKKRVTIVTGSRAEWGLLRLVYDRLRHRPEVSLSVVATGAHHAETLGETIAEIHADKVENLHEVKVFACDKTNSQSQMFSIMSSVMTEIPQKLADLRTQLVVILGDRYEIFAVASAARLMGIPIAHISGGEITIGAFDDCLRHCITKLSDLHFTATDDYRKRVIQLGEQPKFVYDVGELALSGLHNTRFEPKENLESLLGKKLESFFLITLHPETCKPGLVSKALEPFIEMIISKYSDFRLIFTAANADPEGDIINQTLGQMQTRFPASILVVSSLGRLNYLSLARFASCVMGNSSSGIIEIPALRVPVINLGDRQKGRPHSAMVIDCDFQPDRIDRAIQKVLAHDFKVRLKSSELVYDDRNTAERIASIIAEIDLSTIPAAKEFYDAG